jgi:hypothetical protein
MMLSPRRPPPRIRRSGRWQAVGAIRNAVLLGRPDADDSEMRRD